MLRNGTLGKQQGPNGTFGFKVPFTDGGSRSLGACWQTVVLKVQPQSGINKDCLKVAFQNFPPC